MTLDEIIENWLDMPEREVEAKIESFLADPNGNPNLRYQGLFVAYKGETLLTFACRFGKKTIVERLLKINKGENILNLYPVDTNQRSLEGHTPLMCAVMNSHIEIAKLLLENGADVNMSKGGFTALRMAEELNNGKMVTLLRQHGAIITVPEKPLALRRLSLSKSASNPTTIHLVDPDGKEEDISPRFKAPSFQK